MFSPGELSVQTTRPVSFSRAKKLGAAAWDSTKEAAGEAADKTKDVYEAAKESAGDAIESTSRSLVPQGPVPGFKLKPN